MPTAKSNSKSRHKYAALLVFLYTMRIVYEVIKMFFLGITILIGLLYWKGSVLFDATSLATLKQLLLPGYIVLCGVMIGYMLSRG